MGLAKRIIPCLDVDAGRVVKGVRFVDIRDAGDPVEVARRYNEEGADEITFLDITASSDERETMVHVVEQVASEVFIPLTVGGGIRTLDDIRRIASLPSTRPLNPSYTANTSNPAANPARTTARTAAFIPAASPPLVSTARLVGRCGVLNMVAFWSLAASVLACVERRGAATEVGIRFQLKAEPRPQSERLILPSC